MSKIQFKPSQSFIRSLNNEGGNHSINRNRRRNAVAHLHRNKELGESMRELSQSPRAVAARERKEFKEATEHEAHRAEMKRKIELYGPDYSTWPESQSKLVSEIEEMERESH